MIWRILVYSAAFCGSFYGLAFGLGVPPEWTTVISLVVGYIAVLLVGTAGWLLVLVGYCAAAGEELDRPGKDKSGAS